MPPLELTHHISQSPLLNIEMSEKLFLQWNDFQENIKGAFGNFRKDENFNDVTLVCEDGQQVEAHKVILAVSSPFFQKLLGRNKHPHPLVYMKGIEFDHLLAILDFLYCGEANVLEKKLDSFLAIAEDLQLRGLMGKSDEKVEDRDAAEELLPPKLLPSSNTQIDLSKVMKEEPGRKVAVKVKSNMAIATKKLLVAKFVERRGWEATSKITLRPIILKELSSPATSAKKLLGPGML